MFTGGGIVPPEWLDLQHLKFVHVRPRFLRDIRGAAYLRWSLLLTDHTSATCFYMSQGIDTGDIIESCWLPEFFFDNDLTAVDL